MASKKNHKKTSTTITIIVVILAIVLIFSRTCRLMERNVAPADTRTSKSSEQKSFSTEKNIDKQDIYSIEDDRAMKNKASKSNMATNAPFPIHNDEKAIPDKNQLMGIVDSNTRDSLFTTVGAGLGNREGLRMHHKAYEAFVEMHEAARREGISLVVISAWRSFNHQKRIWENKWNGRQVLSGNIYATSIEEPAERATEILRFSAMPGTSRHHWGTDIDINSLNNSYFESGRGKKEYQWLKANASKYGFCQPYTAREKRSNSGYEEEKWHWSYLPVASLYLKTYKDSIGYDHLKGFDGWQTARELSVIENYVLGINPDCL